MPLNNNLNNQGLSPVTFISGTQKYKTGGKLGAYCHDLSSEIRFRCNSLIGIKKFTIMFWVKIEDNANLTSNWNRVFMIEDEKSDNSATGLLRCETCYGSTYDASSPMRGTHWHDNTTYAITNYSPSMYTAADRGIWHHVTFVIDTDTGVWAYTDGVLIGSSTTVYGGHLLDDFYLGNTNNISGGICDLRIYDEVLSPKEIKEISKGLVLHYTLAAPGMENLLKNTNDIVTVNSKSKLYSLSLTPKEFLLQACNKGLTLSYDIHCPGAYPTTTGSLHRLGCYLSCTITNNSTGESKSFYGHHSLSGTPTSRHTLNKTNSLNNVSSSSTATNLDLSFNGHYSRTIYPQNFSAVVDFYNNPDNYTVDITGLRSELNGVNVEENTWIKNVKLEFGDKETPWMPNSADTEYTKMGYNNNIEYDVSGYQNNGTKTGTITYNADTPKYWTSAYFNGSSYISTQAGSFAWFNFDQCTISAWVKPTYKPSSYIGAIGISHDNGTAHKQFSIANHGGIFVAYYNNGSYSNVSSGYELPLNEWHYCVGVLDGTTVYLYVDGILKKTQTIDWGSATVASDGRIQVGIDFPGSDEKYTGYYSDVRIYMTALSASDILTLYNTPVSLTSNGVLMTSGEFSEA